MASTFPPSFRHPLLIDGYMKSCVAGASGPNSGPGAACRRWRGSRRVRPPGRAVRARPRAPARVRPPEPVQVRPRDGAGAAGLRHRPDGVGGVDACGQVRLGARDGPGSRVVGDELVDRRRDIPRIGRCRRVTGEHRRGGHQHRGGVRRIGGGLLNGRPEALHGRQAGRLQPVDRQWRRRVLRWPRRSRRRTAAWPTSRPQQRR